jgi:hypothetical protein
MWRQGRALARCDDSHSCGKLAMAMTEVAMTEAAMTAAAMTAMAMAPAAVIL